MKNMKKSVYVFWGIAAFCILGAIISIPNLQNVLIYLAAIFVFGALGYWQFRKNKLEQQSPDEKAATAVELASSQRQPIAEYQAKKTGVQDKSAAKTAAFVESKVIAPSTMKIVPQVVADIDHGCYSDENYDYWKVKVAGVTFKNGRKSRQTILKNIFFRNEPFNKDEFHSCSLRRGEYEREPSFAICVHDDTIGFVPKENVRFFYENFYRCDGIVLIRVFSTKEMFSARAVIRFRRNVPGEVPSDVPQKITYDKAVLETSNSKVHFWSDEDEEENVAGSAADKPNSIFHNQVVVIDGEFKSFSRRKLCEILRSKGATIASSITSDTDFYILGEIASDKLDYNGMSSNERKLERLNEKGECFAIELNEERLLACLED